MEIEPLKSILSISEDKEGTLCHFLDNDVCKKVMYTDLEEGELYVNDRILCVKKNTLKLDISGCIVSIYGNMIQVRKTSVSTINIDRDKYYIFVRPNVSAQNQREFMKQLLETL